MKTYDINGHEIIKELLSIDHAKLKEDVKEELPRQRKYLEEHDEPSEEYIRGIAEILPNSSPEEVRRIAQSIHQRWKKMNEDRDKLEKTKKETWTNELKERKEIQQRTKDSNECIRPCPEVDKIVTKLTDDSVYGYYDCLHIYYHHGENGAREIMEAGKENMVTADNLIVISDFVAYEDYDLPRKLNELNTELACGNRPSMSKEKKLPKKLRMGW